MKLQLDNYHVPSLTGDQSRESTTTSSETFLRRRTRGYEPSLRDGERCCWRFAPAYSLWHLLTLGRESLKHKGTYPTDPPCRTRYDSPCSLDVHCFLHSATLYWSISFAQSFCAQMTVVAHGALEVVLPDWARFPAQSGNTCWRMLTCTSSHRRSIFSEHRPVADNN